MKNSEKWKKKLNRKVYRLYSLFFFLIFNRYQRRFWCALIMKSIVKFCALSLSTLIIFYYVEANPIGKCIYGRFGFFSCRFMKLRRRNGKSFIRGTICTCLFFRFRTENMGLLLNFNHLPGFYAFQLYSYSLFFCAVILSCRSRVKKFINVKFQVTI